MELSFSTSPALQADSLWLEPKPQMKIIDIAETWVLSGEALNREPNHVGSTESESICVVFQFSSVTQSCPTFCDPMNHSTPGLPVHHQLLEFTQTHVHRVGNAIQPSHPLSSPSPPAPNPSQHQSLFQ